MRLRHLVPCLALIVLAAACSSIERSETPVSLTTLPDATPPDATLPEATPPDAGPTTSTTAPAAADNPADIVVVADGLIASANRAGLRIHRSDGKLVAEFAEGVLVRQPTWSRDATALIATLVDPASGRSVIGLIDTATWSLETTASIRPYFFYSWNVAGDRIAALGPADTGGTAVDIIDAAGQPASDTTAAGLSMYVGWEPGGADLLLHAYDAMVHIDDLDAMEASPELGSPGTRFQAPDWIPGTRDFVVVDATLDPVILVRQNLETGERLELGAVVGFTSVTVNPDGLVAAVAHGPADNSSPAMTDSVSVAYEDGGPVVELVDLATGERTTIIESPGLWLEWSPNGQHLLVATATEGQLAWHVWDGTDTRELVRVTPTTQFVEQYLPFADQYVESPRLWSPDGSAFVVTEVVEGEGRAIAVDARSGQRSVVADATVAFWSPAP